LRGKDAKPPIHEEIFPPLRVRRFICINHQSIFELAGRMQPLRSMAGIISFTDSPATPNAVLIFAMMYITTACEEGSDRLA
jgi:hypothetical protein